MAEDEPGLEAIADDTPRWRRILPFVLAALFSLALGLFIYQSNRAADLRERAVALQRHSYQVMLQTKTVEAAIGNAEALLARFAISHDETVGRQFQDMWDKAGRELTALERATRTIPEQRATVGRLREAMDARGKTLIEIARRVRSRQALGRLGESRNEPSVIAMNHALARLIAFENDRQARHSVQVNRTESRIDFLNDSSMFIGLGLLAATIGALWFANVALNERLFARRLAQAEAARVDDLETAVLERTQQLREANAQLHSEMEERSQAERSLRQLQKMEALGSLTGGIAHDFNNMLAVVMGGIDIARRQLGRDPEKAAQHLDSAMEGAHHASALIERLLAFARSEPLLPDRIEPDTLIAGMKDLITRAIGAGIEVVLELDAGDWLLWADRAQLESALLNMAINARDAMDGRGKLTIATGRTTLKENEIGQCTAGDYVSITVTDTGCGMTPEVMERVFEPFFTTKPMGKGTGLGLSQIFGFVSQCRGTVDLQSEPGAGTTIRLLLPRLLPDAGFATIQEAGATAAANLVSLPEVPEQPLTIMVVEDDARVLRSTMAALAALGHEAIACDHPDQAGESLAAHPEIALILSDIMMPGMSGPEMVEALRPVIADRPVIFVTGFAGDQDARTQLSGYPVLRKPFTVQQLAGAISEAMAGRVQPASAAPPAV